MKREWLERWWWRYQAERAANWLPIDISLRDYARLMWKRFTFKGPDPYPVRPSNDRLVVEVCRHRPQGTGDIFYQPSTCCGGSHLKAR